MDALTRHLDEAGTAAAALDGAIATLNFDPADPASVNAAIRDMERAVDQKVSRYRSNRLVADIAKQTKAHFHYAIRQEAREAVQA